jgi:5'-nucleotidase
VRTVLLDCDELLADYVGAYLRVVYECTGRRYQHSDITAWNLQECLKLSEPEFTRVELAIRRPGFCANLKVLPGAQAGVAKLRGNGDRVLVVTSPLRESMFWVEERYAWLEKHFDIRRDQVFFCERKEQVRGDVLVDDRHEHCSLFPGRAVLWARPHNLTSGFHERHCDWSRV